MTSNTREYDAFGPWVDEVHSVEDLPRLYRSAALDPASYRLMLKIPRDIERRLATPGMHLYDYLLAVDEETFTILSRRDDTYDAVRLPFDRIAAIADSVRLLDGRLTVYTLDGECMTITYNGSAKEPIQNLVRLMRRYYLPQAAPAETYPVGITPVMGSVDTGLRADYDRVMAQEPGMHLVTVADGQVAVPISRLERLYRAARPKVLRPCIMVADDREIQLIHRRDWFTPPGDDLSMARTILPRARIDAITVSPHGRYLGVHLVTVQAGVFHLQFPMAASPFTEALRTGDQGAIST